MHLRENFNKKPGRTYLQIVHGYRDQQGKSKTKVHLNAGYLDKLEKEYDNPIAYFKNLAEKMDAERQEAKYINLKIKTNEKIDRSKANRKNYGHKNTTAKSHENDFATLFMRQFSIVLQKIS